jgi:twitching motility two-component system response regulator PilH
MHLKLRRKPSRLLLHLAAERSRQTCKSLTIRLLYKIDTLAQGISRLAADVHFWSAEKYGVMSMLQKKVLIVDDSPSQVKLIQGFLEHEGYRLVGINDPERVEEAIALERPSVILLDVVMPKRNGFQVCRELKSHADYNAIPVILVTSKNTESDRFWGQQQGADGYVTKPFTREELLRAVRRFA